eukprot:7220492-Prymnesium_polylepis.1
MRAALRVRRRRKGGSGRGAAERAVMPVSDEAVLRAEAFILLYERQGKGGDEGGGDGAGEGCGGEAGGNEGGGGGSEGAALSEDGKKARKLKKLLRQIEELKAALTARGGEPTAAEKGKLEREAEVRAELAALEA